MSLVHQVIRIALATEVRNAPLRHDEGPAVHEQLTSQFGERVVGRIVSRRGGHAEVLAHVTGGDLAV